MLDLRVTMARHITQLLTILSTLLLIVSASPIGATSTTKLTGLNRNPLIPANIYVHFVVEESDEILARDLSMGINIAMCYLAIEKSGDMVAPYYYAHDGLLRNTASITYTSVQQTTNLELASILYVAATNVRKNWRQRRGFHFRATRFGRLIGTGYIGHAPLLLGSTKPGQNASESAASIELAVRSGLSGSSTLSANASAKVVAARAESKVKREVATTFSWLPSSPRSPLPPAPVDNLIAEFLLSLMYVANAVTGIRMPASFYLPEYQTRLIYQPAVVNNIGLMDRRDAAQLAAYLASRLYDIELYISGTAVLHKTTPEGTEIGGTLQLRKA